VTDEVRVTDLHAAWDTERLHTHSEADLLKFSTTKYMVEEGCRWLSAMLTSLNCLLTSTIKSPMDGLNILITRLCVH